MQLARAAVSRSTGQCSDWSMLLPEHACQAMHNPSLMCCIFLTLQTRATSHSECKVLCMRFLCIHQDDDELHVCDFDERSHDSMRRRLAAPLSTSRSLSSALNIFLALRGRMRHCFFRRVRCDNMLKGCQNRPHLTLLLPIFSPTRQPSCPATSPTPPTPPHGLTILLLPIPI